MFNAKQLLDDISVMHVVDEICLNSSFTSAQIPLGFPSATEKKMSWQAKCSSPTTSSVAGERRIRVTDSKRQISFQHHVEHLTVLISEQDSQD